MSDVYNSRFARWVGKLNKSLPYAVTTSATCTRYSCQESEVDTAWRAHEETHKTQIKRLGWIKFMFGYFSELLKNGYQNNKFEIEARGKNGNTRPG